MVRYRVQYLLANHRLHCSSTVSEVWSGRVCEHNEVIMLLASILSRLMFQTNCHSTFKLNYTNFSFYFLVVNE